MLKGIGNLASMLKQAQEIGTRMQGVADELRLRRATGSAGGGLVEIEVNGLSEVLRCRIDPSLVQQGDRELLEDLVAAAVNQAFEKAKQLHAEAIKSLTGNLDLPGLKEAMGKLTQEDSEE
jgi:DNA-binding YbaB/EbfC family protein